MATLREFASSKGVCADDTLPPVPNYEEPYARSAEEVASRAIILHCVVATGYDVDSLPIVEWLKEERLWDNASPNERKFLCAKSRTEKELSDARWRQEAEWALLWLIGKVDSLGLPVTQCDTARLVDEIMPGLGDSTIEFLSCAQLRHPSLILSEVDRIYNLHCYIRGSLRNGDSLPSDLIYDVLYQRHYAFDWFRGVGEWDVIPVDT